jgi:hypothetical protein
MTNPDNPATAPIAVAASTNAPIAVSAVRTWAWVLAAGLAAGVIAWAIGEATLVPEASYENKKEHIHVALSVAGIRNGTISFAALGAVTGLALGLAGGLIGRSNLRALAAGAIGLVLGGGGAAALSWVILPVYYEHSTSGELTYSMLVHCGVWAAVGAAAGLAWGIGLGGWREALRSLLGGACAALLASVIYEFAGGILFPRALTDRPISLTAETRLLARLIVTVMVAAGVVLAARSPGGGTSVNDANTTTAG